MREPEPQRARSAFAAAFSVHFRSQLERVAVLAVAVPVLACLLLALVLALPAVSAQPVEQQAASAEAVQEVAGDVTVDVHQGREGGLLGGARLPPPEDMPKHWLRAPCPDGKRVRTIQGACFLAYGKPPCELGHEVKGECVVALNRGQKVPVSIDRSEP